MNAPGGIGEGHQEPSAPSSRAGREGGKQGEREGGREGGCRPCGRQRGRLGGGERGGRRRPLTAALRRARGARLVVCGVAKGAGKGGFSTKNASHAASWRRGCVVAGRPPAPQRLRGAPRPPHTKMGVPHKHKGNLSPCKVSKQVCLSLLRGRQAGFLQPFLRLEATGEDPRSRLRLPRFCSSPRRGAEEMRGNLVRPQREGKIQARTKYSC